MSRLPFADDVTAESRVLMRRLIGERVRALAPFLIYDSDPYIVIARDGRLHWMIDAYTETDKYPYARHYTVDRNRVNYIRNSVKATIDAYDGSVAFYVFDNDDPILRAYRNLFPALPRGGAEAGRFTRHVATRKLFERAGRRLGLYHTENASILPREDMWSGARETTRRTKGNEAPARTYSRCCNCREASGAAPATTEFINIVAFTPASRDNLIGWMAGRCDGAAYGSLLVYKFPKSKLVNGPLQVNARIDQNAQLSSQLTLWNQQGSRVQRGNLLIIPLGRALLYVQRFTFKRRSRARNWHCRPRSQYRLAYGTTFAEASRSLR